MISFCAVDTNLALMVYFCSFSISLEDAIFLKITSWSKILELQPYIACVSLGNYWEQGKERVRLRSPSQRPEIKATHHRLGSNFTNRTSSFYSKSRFFFCLRSESGLTSLVLWERPPKGMRRQAQACTQARFLDLYTLWNQQVPPGRTVQDRVHRALA